MRTKVKKWIVLAGVLAIGLTVLTCQVFPQNQDEGFLKLYQELRTNFSEGRYSEALANIEALIANLEELKAIIEKEMDSQPPSTKKESPYLIPNPETKHDYKIVLSSIKREKTSVTLRFLVTPLDDYIPEVHLRVRIWDDHGNEYVTTSVLRNPDIKMFGGNPRRYTIPQLTFTQDVRIDVPEVAKLETVEIWQEVGGYREAKASRLNFKTGVFVQPKFKDYGDMGGKRIQGKHYLWFTIEGLNPKNEGWIAPITVENEDYNDIILYLYAHVQYLDGTFDDLYPEHADIIRIPYFKALSKQKVFLTIKPRREGISQVRNLIITYRRPKIMEWYTTPDGKRKPRLVTEGEMGHIIWTVKE